MCAHRTMHAHSSLLVRCQLSCTHVIANEELTSAPAASSSPPARACVTQGMGRGSEVRAILSTVHRPFTHTCAHWIMLT
ncbi:hypothetical protein JB92DRAFT_2987178 [Gautieria morchelliformis]|nr:hypothetical protein JB92DRAFT_2987178 [Gautieria morchelliformis]